MKKIDVFKCSKFNVNANLSCGHVYTVQIWTAEEGMQIMTHKNI